MNPLLSIFRPLVLFQVQAPKEPDFVEKYKRLAKHANKIVDTAFVEHHEAYLKGTEHLRDKNNKIDYEKLEEGETADKVADEMAKVYRDRAQKMFKSGLKVEDEIEHEMLTQALYGTTRAQIRAAIAELGKKYTLRQHTELVEKQYLKEVEKSLRGVAFQHIKDKHIDDILKYTKADEAAKAHGYELNKAAIDRNAALNLLSKYVDSGYLTKPHVEEIGLPVFRKKKK